MQHSLACMKDRLELDTSGLLTAALKPEIDALKPMNRASWPKRTDFRGPHSIRGSGGPPLHPGTLRPPSK